ncbi:MULTISPECIES: ATP-binding cassette domain-containing protein [unclassified Chelatococcus]|uniref:ABC transporter ATP-binding protein n=1 Tax=unclassified Chelatococcus TaxID=2638111 RepID=UPI001BCF53F4|nr:MULTISPECIES: ATP-binding cassette domain-containing protein [unclassified Chelatococcus]MBS7700032.1 ATP-binding cassette domain-containing protein [Chelatococcus sp. YT9]MBX3556725.1 ATP-binding cassette domain-containing protein [Chelatococcus sp.]
MTIRIDEKSYPAAPGSPSRPLIADLRLDVSPGQVCAITGPSGIGKSTLLSIVAGLDPDFRGDIANRPRPIGFMFQTPRLLPWASVRRNVELAIPGREVEASRWIAAVGLAGHEAAYPERLSLGMARRVGLARALAIHPALLLLDEPFASLDIATAEVMRTVLRTEIAARGVTVLLVTHELSLAAELADRVILLDGAPARILHDVKGGRCTAATAGGETSSRSGRILAD